MASIDDILKKAKPLTRSTTLCLDGELLGRQEELVRQVGEAKKGSPEARRLLGELGDVNVAVEDASVTFVFRGWNQYEFDAWQARHPSASGKGMDALGGAAELVAACAVEPEMTVEQARNLLEQVNQGTADQLFTAAYLASTKDTRVPFSGGVSASTSGTGSR